MRALSPVFLRAIHGAESQQVLLPLVRLSHPSWPDDVRIVPDWRPLVHQGAEYLPYAFEIALPDDDAEGLPVLRWVADNVSRDLVAALRAVTDKVSARVVWVLASQPDFVEAGPFDVEMTAVEYDAQTLTGTMQIEPILDEPFGYFQMTPRTTPGLF